MKSPINIELAKELLSLEPSVPKGELPLGAPSATIEFEFRGRKVVSFSSWDVFGVSSRRDLRQSVVSAVDSYGWGSGVARPWGGNSPDLIQSETRVAQFLGAESGTFFSTKNQAVLSTITALFTEGDLIVCPSLTHAPVADAASLVGAEVFFIDSPTDSRLVDKMRGRRRVGLFLESTCLATGEVNELADWMRLAESNDLWVVLDESASLGVSGLRGAGSADIFPWHSRLVARVAPLSFVAALSGCVVVSSKELRALLLARSRYLRCEPVEPPALLRAVPTVVDYLESAVTARDSLLLRAKSFKNVLQTQGWVVNGGDFSPILSISLDTYALALSLSDALLQRGHLLEAVSAKTRGRDGGVVRILLSLSHTVSQTDALLESFMVIRERTISSMA